MTGLKFQDFHNMKSRVFFAVLYLIKTVDFFLRYKVQRISNWIPVAMTTCQIIARSYVKLPSDFSLCISMEKDHQFFSFDVFPSDLQLETTRP